MRRKILALAAAVALGTATMTTGAMALGTSQGPIGGGSGKGAIGGGGSWAGAGHWGGNHFAGHVGRGYRGGYGGLWAFGGDWGPNYNYCYNNWPYYYGYNSCGSLLLRLVSRPANKEPRPRRARLFCVVEDVGLPVCNVSMRTTGCVQPNRPRS